MKQSSLLLLRYSVRSTHRRTVTCVILVCLFYLPTWLSTIVELIVHGSSETWLNFGFIYLGFRELWRKRQQLAYINLPKRIACSVIYWFWTVLLFFRYSWVLFLCKRYFARKSGWLGWVIYGFKPWDKLPLPSDRIKSLYAQIHPSENRWNT